MDTSVDKICQSLGIPVLAYQGDAYSSLTAEYLKILEQRQDNQRRMYLKSFEPMLQDTLKRVFIGGFDYRRCTWPAWRSRAVNRLKRKARKFSMLNITWFHAPVLVPLER